MAFNIQSNIIGVLGGKGGVGKSVFAANLAFAILKELKAPTLLIDLDSASCGDQNVITGLRPTKTISEIANYAGSINPNTIKTLITQHPVGLHFIGAVHNPTQRPEVQANILMPKLEILSNFYQYIILDLGSQLDDVQMSVIDRSTTCILITTPEILVVNQTNRLMGQLMSATFPSEMFQIVINRGDTPGLPQNSISQALRRPILSVLPTDDISSANALQRSLPIVIGQPNSPLAHSYHDVVRKLTGGILQKLKATHRPSTIKAKPAETNLPQDNSSTGGRERQVDPRNLLKRQIHHELIVEMDLKRQDMSDMKNNPEKEKELVQKTQQTISRIVDRLSPNGSREERSRIIKEVLDEALFLGPLEDMLADPDITEIMVNGFDRIFIEKRGKIQLSPITFTSNQQLRNVIERIVTPLGRTIDEKTPYVDARIRGGVADGSRVNAVIEPLSIDGPAVTIRKFSKDPITPNHYVDWGTATKSMLDFLKICVENGLNLIISGGTGSGKTTLLNVLSGFIPSNERIITVEDAAELQLKQEHVVRLETRPSNMEGTGSITIRDLIRNSLRMRPDRIVVGETRDGAALDMLQAMNTGHDGSMTTVHANNPRECIGRIETLCLMAGMDLPMRAIREQVASAVNLIVQISRLSDGSRKIISITEVIGMQGEAVTLQEIFKFKEEGFDKNRKIIGSFQATGMIPTFIEKMEQKGVVIPRTLFSNAQAAPPTQNTTPTTIGKPRPTIAPTRPVAPVKKPTGTEGQ